MRVQIGEEFGCVVAEHHIERGYLACIGVGLADRGASYHLRMTGRRILDDRRIDVVAGADDQILGTAGDADEAPGADGTEVAGDEPSVCREGGGRVAEIAWED